MTESTAPIRVLVADDDDEERAIVIEALAMAGHQVVAEVKSGPDAVTFARAELPDVVVLDVFMPGGSGVDAAKEITASHPGTAVLLFTAKEDFTLSDADLDATAAISTLPKVTSAALIDNAVRAAAAHARRLRTAREGEARALQLVENRKVVERAKGILQRRTACTEQEAYRILQRSSQDKSEPMVVVAQRVLDSEPDAAPRPAREERSDERGPVQPRRDRKA